MEISQVEHHTIANSAIPNHGGNAYLYHSASTCFAVEDKGDIGCVGCAIDTTVWCGVLCLWGYEAKNKNSWLERKSSYFPKSNTAITGSDTQ